MLVKEEAEIMKTLIKLTYNGLKEIKMFHLVKKQALKFSEDHRSGVLTHTYTHTHTHTHTHTRTERERQVN